MNEEKQTKPTKTEFIKQIQDSMNEIQPRTSAYDLKENGGFQKTREMPINEFYNKLIKF